MTNKPTISILIPAKNDKHHLINLLESLLLSEFKDFEVIVNEAQDSTEKLDEVIAYYAAQGLQILHLHSNIATAQARKAAAEAARGEIMLHLDCDMIVAKELLGECLNLIMNQGYSALVLPERSFGGNFLARCKILEKECYMGNIHIESLRALKSEVYFAVGGHDLQMVYYEEKDLDLKVRSHGEYRVGRTKSVIMHNEGKPSLQRLLNKKGFYAKTANIFAQKYPQEFAWQRNIFMRYWIFLRRFDLFFKDPLAYCGLLIIKTLEYAAAALNLLSRFWPF
jgi:arabinofuranan 3-O-arabinosyltransferase